jgi:hypothetical protein
MHATWSSLITQPIQLIVPCQEQSRSRRWPNCFLITINLHFDSMLGRTLELHLLKYTFILQLLINFFFFSPLATYFNRPLRVSQREGNFNYFSPCIAISLLSWTVRIFLHCELLPNFISISKLIVCCWSWWTVLQEALKILGDTINIQGVLALCKFH